MSGNEPVAQPQEPQQQQLPQLQTAYVSFSAEINVKTAESLLGLMSDLSNKGTQRVYLMLSTPGGSVMHGITLYNVLRAFPFRLAVHNVGNVDSIGNAIFLAGEERYASPHSTFMFHGVGLDVNQPTRLEEKSLREHMGAVLTNQKRIGAVIEERTQLQPDAIAALFLEAQTKDAAYAVGCGIVHEIKDVKIPNGCPVYSLVFQR